MMRVALYVRYSTDLQDPRSIEDQITLLRALCEREGWGVVMIYSDRAASGASVHLRPDMQRLMRDAKTGMFDMVLAEDFYRLARDMEDLAGLYKRMNFAGIVLRTAYNGVADPVTIGAYAMIGQVQREATVKNQRRAFAGRVKEGRRAGGKAYGYRPMPGSPGRSIIVEAEADIVRRVYMEYADDKRTPREIAADLNRDGIAPPQNGRRWSASTLNGNKARGVGILRNAIYVGRVVWNKVRILKDPDTGKSVTRPNPTVLHEVGAAPHLAIIDEALWKRVQDRLAARTINHPSHQRRPKRLLSGIAVCGICGGGMTSLGKSASGKLRMQCSASRETGTCTAQRKFATARVERLVLSGLADRLNDRSFFLDYIAEYNAERRRLALGSGERRLTLEKRQATVEQELQRAASAIVSGIIRPETMRETIAEKEAERDRISADLATLPSADNVVVLHPSTTFDRYRDSVARLSELLDTGEPTNNIELIGTLRALLSRVAVFPAADNKIEVEVTGRLQELVAPWGGKVAGSEGLEPPTLRFEA